MRVWPNPYAHLDHLGRLAGVVRRPPPFGGAIGASIDQDHARATYSPGTEAVGISPKSDIRYTFADDAVDVGEDRHTAQHYMQAIHAGQLLKAHGASAPIEALAKARAAAIAKWVAHYGSEPDTANWAKQFPLDVEVAKWASKPDSAVANKKARADQAAKES